MKKISRYGAYGVIVKEQKLLLTQKKSGPYIALWGLPGGQIDFGESPEEALKRELIEEAALEAGGLELLTVTTATGIYENSEGPYQFHQIGMIYRVVETKLSVGRIPEEKTRWVDLSLINFQELTPFAKSAIPLLIQF